MARRKNHAKRIENAVHQLLEAVNDLVEESSKAIANAKSSAAKSGKGRGAGRATPASLSAGQRSYWASLTPAQHRARVRKMLAGRGLKPKRKTKRK